MKKIILNSLLGVMLCGSAFAEMPTVEIRKEACLNHPDKYVWVEKNSTCIPRNPCLSDNKQIKESYCAPVFNVTAGIADRVMNMYIEQVLKTSSTDKVIWNGSLKRVDNYNSTRTNFVAHHLDNGGYITFPLYVDDPMNFELTDSEPNGLYKNAACMAYGLGEYKGSCSNAKHINSAKCTDIADFTSLIGDMLCTGEMVKTDNGSIKECVITCDDEHVNPEVIYMLKNR